MIIVSTQILHIARNSKSIFAPKCGWVTMMMELIQMFQGIPLKAPLACMLLQQCHMAIDGRELQLQF
jgi:hypothetical protein